MTTYSDIATLNKDVTEISLLTGISGCKQTLPAAARQGHLLALPASLIFLSEPLCRFISTSARLAGPNIDSL